MLLKSTATCGFYFKNPASLKERLTFHRSLFAKEENFVGFNGNLQGL